jgi:hypothetical protein
LGIARQNPQFFSPIAPLNFRWVIVLPFVATRYRRHSAASSLPTPSPTASTFSTFGSGNNAGDVSGCLVGQELRDSLVDLPDAKLLDAAAICVWLEAPGSLKSALLAGEATKLRFATQNSSQPQIDSPLVTERAVYTHARNLERWSRAGSTSVSVILLLLHRKAFRRFWG